MENRRIAGSSVVSGAGTGKVQQESAVITYDAPHPIYAMAISPHPSPSPPLVALGSFIENYSNRVDVVPFSSPSPTAAISFDHNFPPTKLLFHPNQQLDSPLLASSSDYLRLWRLQHDSNSASLHSILNNASSVPKSAGKKPNAESCAPLTSFDWNPFEPRHIVTASIDTTCTVWDVDVGAIETQLIAHDREVFDVAWGEANVFASVSADASLRVFDLRDKEHSNILYESPRPDIPILRLAWNRADLRYMACILMDSPRIVVLDIRFPTAPVVELARHRAAVNAISWSPTAPQHICSAGDDGQALIWELSGGAPASPDGIDPSFSYSAGTEINQLQWAAGQQEWIGIAFANKVQMLRV